LFRVRREPKGLWLDEHQPHLSHAVLGRDQVQKGNGHVTREAAHECLHGLVADRAATDCGGGARGAQRRDQQAAGSALEELGQRGAKAIH